jgi:hypothetical protein
MKRSEFCVARFSDTFAVESRLREMLTCQQLVQHHEIMLQSIGSGIKYRARGPPIITGLLFHSVPTGNRQVIILESKSRQLPSTFLSIHNQQTPSSFDAR